MPTAELRSVLDHGRDGRACIGYGSTGSCGA